jgi:CheY-like chemotaxis protein
MPQILLIEDDDQFRQMLVQMLKGDGHTVTIAVNGLEALEKLKTWRPDLILTDILMAKMDGVETIMELAKRGIAVPIIAMSGGRRSITSDFNLNSAEMLGVSATLSKPFARADLRQAITAALGAAVTP